MPKVSILMNLCISTYVVFNIYWVIKTDLMTKEVLAYFSN